jgi:YidC/Oxa1 family membrane protein insertase
MSFIWNDLLVNPMINALIILANALFDNFGLALIAFTILIRLATFPLTIRQLRTTRAMQEMQPQLQEIQKKYKDPKRRQQEMMKLYKEVGFNPLGCIVPFAVQMPIWIALFQVVRKTLGTTPESLLGLSSRLYDWDFITHSVPLDSNFLFMDLAERSVPLAILVAIATFYQQKLSTATRSAAKDDRQAATNRMMLYLMPLLFGWFTLTVPAGLGLYWFTTSLVGIAMSYLYYKPDNITFRWLFSLDALPPSPKARAAAAIPGKATPASATSLEPGSRSEDTSESTNSVPEDNAGASDGRSAAARRRRRRRRRGGGSGGARREGAD